MDLRLTDYAAIAIVVGVAAVAVYKNKTAILAKLTGWLSVFKKTPVATSIFADDSTDTVVSSYMAWRELYELSTACPAARTALVEVVLPAVATGMDLQTAKDVFAKTTVLASNTGGLA